MASAVLVPPGSLVDVTEYPASRRAAPRRRICVLFPLPSGPSSVRNTPPGRLRFRLGPIALRRTRKTRGIVVQVIENSNKTLATALPTSV